MLSDGALYALKRFILSLVALFSTVPFPIWRDRINQQSLGRGRGVLFPAPAMPMKGGRGSCVSFRS